MDKVTLKIFSDVYKRLKMYGVENDCKTLSDAIKKLLDEAK